MAKDKKEMDKNLAQKNLFITCHDTSSFLAEKSFLFSNQKQNLFRPILKYNSGFYSKMVKTIS